MRKLSGRALSIIIPHYQKQEALQKTWDELIKQIHPNDEIIIVDDNSPDDIQEFDCDCTRVITVPKITPHIYRLCTVRNHGIKHAKHDACIILDPDCIPNPTFLNSARRMFDPSVLFAGRIDKTQEDGSIKIDTRSDADKSYWCDLRDKGGYRVWGGCMMFSKSRTRLIDWFDEDYNGAWGAEEHDFASKCYHSGMRLRYSTELQVTHQYHPKNTDGNKRNLALWKQKTESYRNHLDTFTSYKPAVGVMIITMMRPSLLDQCIRSVFRNRMALRVRLVNNGDTGEDTRRICEEWGRRWSVDYVNHPRKWPAEVRNDSLMWAKKHKLKYLVFIDDDVIVVNNGIVELVKTMEKEQDIYALSGKLNQPPQQPRLLGGPLRDNMFYRFTDRKGVYDSDWVGGGFTIHRLNPMLLYDDGYETGFNDYDWSMMAKRDGHRLAVTGDAEAYHAVKFTSEGVVRHKNSTEYNKVRYDKERHNRMRKRFEDKWGFWLEGGGYTDK